MKLKGNLCLAIVIALSGLLTMSCNDDFNTVGNEVLGDVNFNDSLYTAIPVSYSKRLDTVQTSRLDQYLLGTYEDPIYGKSTYSVLSQIQPENFDPDFEDDIELDSVVLSIPYYSRIVTSPTSDDPRTIYELDSVYGNSPFKLSVFRSKYFLSDFNSGDNSDERKIYYSNDINSFGLNEPNSPLLESLAVVDNFVPSADEIKIKGPDGNDDGTERDDVRIAPQLRVQLPVAHFKSQILDKEGMPELSNANNFRNYYRGIYLKAEQINANSGNLFGFNISEARIIMYYRYSGKEVNDTNGDGDTDDIVTRDDGEFTFSFSNNIINGIENTFNTSVETELATTNQDTINGEDNLYLKGGSGAYAIINILNRHIEADSDGQPILDNNNNVVYTNTPDEGDITELEYIQEQNWLIKEANLKLYVNKNSVTGGATEPERIYIFDTETGRVLIDYSADFSENETNPVNSRIFHSERITRDSDGNGDFYKIRLTRHIIDVLNGDIVNTTLGISVSQNVNITALGFASPKVNNENTIVPLSSILSHEGTILYGNTEAVPEDKRLTLNIFYTASKN